MRPWIRPTRSFRQRGAQLLDERARGARLDGLGLVDQRADPVRLSAGRAMRRHALDELDAPALGQHRGQHRLAARRQLVDHRAIEIRVRGHRERPRDRRRGHDQLMRRARVALALPLELQPLLHAEAMLLVDDHERESVERRRLPGTARACRSRRPRGRRRSARATRRARARSASRAASRRASSSGPSQRSKLAACCSASSSVGAITAVCLRGDGRDERRERGDHGLARADVALQQPVHRRVSAEVREDLRERAVLLRAVSGNGSAARKRASSSRGSGNGHERSLRIAAAEARSDNRCATSSSSAMRRCAGWRPVASSAVAASCGGRCSSSSAADSAGTSSSRRGVRRARRAHSRAALAPRRSASRSREVIDERLALEHARARGRRAAAAAPGAAPRCSGRSA